MNEAEIRDLCATCKHSAASHSWVGDIAGLWHCHALRCDCLEYQ